MLFNSAEFLFGFLPAAALVFFLLGRLGRMRAALVALLAASLFFYSWWNPAHLPLLLISLGFNYGLAQWLSSARAGQFRRLVLTLGIGANLAALGWFKYANFFAANLAPLLGTGFDPGPIVLPLAISFFTFQQITYLVDAADGRAERSSFLNYALFVTFFPHLIAGPLVHHRQMLPQFSDPRIFQLDAGRIALGLAIFSIGLFKKVAIADSVALYANPVFAAARDGADPSFFIAWGGALAYTFQLYFDFSGYSDMAVGLALVFGIRLPLNFNSPYKATSIVEFWRRWHITLSNFLRDYLYIPLGGNRGGTGRRLRNLMITMLLGGLWHGAGWTFVLWGGLHGLFLAINHLWTGFRTRIGLGPMHPVPAWCLTFAAVVAAWVFFRAESLDGALRIVSGMAGLNGVAIPAQLAKFLGPLAPVLERAGLELTGYGGLDFVMTWLWCLALLPAVLLLPNTAQIFARHQPVVEPPARAAAAPAAPLRPAPPLMPAPIAAASARLARLGPVAGMACALLVFVVLKRLNAGMPSEFIYFNF